MPGERRKNTHGTSSFLFPVPPTRAIDQRPQRTRPLGLLPESVGVHAHDFPRDLDCRHLPRIRGCTPPRDRQANQTLIADRRDFDAGTLIERLSS